MPQAVLPVAGAAAPLLQVLRSGPLGSLMQGGLGAGMLPAVGAPVPPQQPPQAMYAAAPAQPQGSSSSLGSPPTGVAAAGRTGAVGSSPGTRSTGTPAAVPPAASSSGSVGAGGDGSGDPSRIAGLAGVWIKDQAASDTASYSRACDLLQASRVWTGCGLSPCIELSWAWPRYVLLTPCRLPQFNPVPAAAEWTAEDDRHAAD